MRNRSLLIAAAAVSLSALISDYLMDIPACLLECDPISFAAPELGPTPLQRAGQHACDVTLDFRSAGRE